MTEIQELIDGLTARPILTPNQRLWDAELCAQYLGMSAQYFRKNYACKEDFPGAIRLGDGPKAPLRWIGKDIVDWANARKNK